MGTRKINMKAVGEAISAAKDHGDEVRRILYADIGLTDPNPPEKRPGEPLSTYHRERVSPKPDKNAAVEGAEVEEELVEETYTIRPNDPMPPIHEWEPVSDELVKGGDG